MSAAPLSAATMIDKGTVTPDTIFGPIQVPGDSTKYAALLAALSVLGLVAGAGGAFLPMIDGVTDDWPDVDADTGVIVFLSSHNDGVQHTALCIRAKYGPGMYARTTIDLVIES